MQWPGGISDRELEALEQVYCQGIRVAAYLVCSLCAASVPHHTNARGSIGGNDGRKPVRDLHTVEDAGGVGLRECLAAPIWEALDRCAES